MSLSIPRTETRRFVVEVSVVSEIASLVTPIDLADQLLEVLSAADLGPVDEWLFSVDGVDPDD